MAYTFSPMTPRVEKMRERYRTTQPQVCLARYKIMTDFYKNNNDLIGILKRAKNFRNICEKLPLRVDEDEIIVGSATAMYRGACVLQSTPSAGFLTRQRQTSSTQEMQTPIFSQKKTVTIFWQQATSGSTSVRVQRQTQPSLTAGLSMQETALQCSVQMARPSTL